MNPIRIQPQRNSRRRKSTSIAARRLRSGFASGLMLMMLVFLAGFLAIGLNVSRLSQMQAQLRAVCQASALAGATELLDEGFLAGYPDQRDDILAARESARQTARSNSVDGRVVELASNLDNAPLGDIVVGSIEPLALAGQAIALPLDIKQAKGLNTVRVVARLKLNTYNKVTLFLGALTGMLSSDAASSAQATLDRRIAGFRPEPGVKVPVMPLVADYDSWMKQATARATNVNDRYTVNYQTGEVLAGPDGIPEVLVSTGAKKASDGNDADTQASGAEADAKPSTDKPSAADASLASPPPAWCRAMDLYSVPDIGTNTPAKTLNVWQVRCRDGLSADDLRQFSGQLVVQQGAIVVPVLPALPNEMPYALMDIVGSSRAWPLAEAGSDDASCAIVGFAAGRIVAVRRPVATQTNAQSETWELVVQPTTLVSSQAVTTANMNPNPWIGKLELTQ
ncbi:MAG: hypothetical protein K8U03_19690 [Planctomycetia bacterium]|nr:hypothetical protein [Planctomycetia bacterium]